MICFVCLEYAATGNNLNKGGHCMEITRNEESRILSVWLTNADQQNEEIQNWLKGKYPVWKKEGYLTVVYKSGHEDLYENTPAGSAPRRRSKRKSRPGSRPKQKGWPGSSRWRKCQPRHSLRRKCAPECKPRQTRPQSQASWRSWAKSRPSCKAGRNSAQGSTARWIVDPLPPPFVCC